MNIEVEIRSFLTKDQFDKLLQFFKSNATLEKEDYQETFYFDCEQDLRIQKNNTGAKVWLKDGKIHDDQREEVEIRFSGNDFDKMEKLFKKMGHGIEVKWFRERNQFDWNGIKVCLDYTKGYGYIIELEKMASDDNKDQVLQELKEKLKELNIEETPKEEFKNRFNEYVKNWEELTK